jgi:hypothetical protein
LVSVGELVSRFLAKREGHPARANEAIAMRVFAQFQKIGAPITEHAEPALLRGGILTLTVSSSAWLTELTFLKSEILERVNAGATKPVVRDLRMRLGSVSKKKIEKAKPPELSSEELAKVEAWGDEIKSEEVRQAMMRAAAWTLHRPKPTRPLYEGPPGPMPTKKEPVPEVKVEPPKDRWQKDRDRWKK